MPEALQNTESAEKPSIVNLLVTINVLDENYQEALARLSLKPEDFNILEYFIGTKVIEVKLNVSSGPDDVNMI